MKLATSMLETVGALAVGGIEAEAEVEVEVKVEAAIFSVRSLASWLLWDVGVEICIPDSACERDAGGSAPCDACVPASSC